LNWRFLLPPKFKRNNMGLVTAELLNIHHHPFGSKDPNGAKIAYRFFLPPLLAKSAQQKIQDHLTNYFITYRKMTEEIAKKRVAQYKLRFYYNSPYHHHGRGKLGLFGKDANQKLPLENLADCYFLDNGKKIELHIFDNITFH
jgi:hypothetical protein